MAFGESTTSDDVLAQYSLDKILAIAIERGLSLGRIEGYAAGHKHGYEDGYKRGHTDGYGAAKGKKSSRITAKKDVTTKEVIAIATGKLGRPASSELFMRTAIDVLSCMAHGKAELSNQEIPKEVATFLKSPRAGNWPTRWPKPKSLLTEYSRQIAKRNRQTEIDKQNKRTAELLHKLRTKEKCAAAADSSV